MKKIYTLVIAIITCLGVVAQDMHFSQYWGAPTHINPALTGVFNGSVRMGANYRNQWFAQSAYTTYAASVDANVMSGKLNGNLLGMGLSFYQDVEGQGAFTNTGIHFSLAYNQKLGAGSSNHYLGLGLQAGYLSKQVDLRNIVYGNLFEINQNTDPIDANNYNRKGTIDFNLGTQYFGTFKEKQSILIGLSLAHVAQPNLGFNTENPEPLFRRFSINSSANLVLKNEAYKVNPVFLYQQQGPHKELNTGAFFGFVANSEENVVVYLGAMYRLAAYTDKKLGGDAFITAARLEYKSFDIGISYDITLSDLRNAGGFMGGPEIYMMYIVPSKSNNKNRNKIYCPKF